MNSFILDNSVTMRWLLATPQEADQRYAEVVLQNLVEIEATVPHLWHLEVVNVLVIAEKRGELVPAEVERFLTQLEGLPVQVDSLTAYQAFSRTISLARACKLSSYDAAYLELAIRTGLPLATLDKDLIKAAGQAEVSLYLGGITNNR